ncbi:hypothetical protein C8R43DRAFT_1125114 [Mycena crocata]|nr:hypothetical protein C8R43DRAFT_1125114 [Mycena crocata]
MFSKLFILCVSALSIVDAIPTQATWGGCGEIAASYNFGPKMVPGAYRITQPFRPNNPKYLEAEGPGNPLLMQTAGGDAPYPPVWLVHKIGEDQFQLQSHPDHLVASIPALLPGWIKVIGSHDPTLQSTWAIESAGNDLWTIKVPNKDLVWKEYGSTIGIANADGSPQEHWHFEFLGPL